jgi:serine/threonine protein kinase
VNARWTQVTPSEFPWEREALAFLKERLPDHEPYAAWANFEFIHDGAIGEVDVLVVAPRGVFLIEIKSWPGRLEGDAGTWRTTRPGETRSRRFDNPLLLTNRKAKRLKSLLTRQRAFRAERVPFVVPLVFLSHPELDCSLDGDARAGICGLDETSSQRGGLPGIVAKLTGMKAEERERLGNRRIDRPMAKRLATALEQAGVRPSQHHRHVGDLDLGELMEEGPGYQDFAAVHPRFEHTHRRVRIYGTSDTAGPDERAQALRAAQREFELLSPVTHPGIVSALAFHEHELGPAIVFDRDSSEIRLDHHLEQVGATLDLDGRLGLVRELAETVAYVHGRRLFHRALSPRSIHVVRPATPDQRCVVGNWQTGTRASGGTLSVTVEGTRHVDQLVDQQAAAYLAPEALTQPEADPELLDVFSLGAIAFHVFTGRPPAASLPGLVELLQRDGALEVAGVLDGAGPALSEMVRAATAADASQRTESVDDFLVLLDLVEDELTAPTETVVPEPSPLEAGKGDLLGGFLVERRLGRGSTAIALLVTDAEDQRRVLKVAADPDKNDRVREEGEVLAALRDRTIIATYGEPIDLAGHTAIVLAHASEGTLAKRLREEGRLGLETLERWGQDLLSSLNYLEQVGIPHRDIKPENLGIMELGSRKQRQLVLMDFSLARAPVDQIRAGTPPYLDPFLGTARRMRWDLAADRYAAAMVLHEMAAGTLPIWGDGNSNPQFAGVEEVTVDRDALPRELAVPLSDFFARALRANAEERFDTADDMLRAWRQMFARLDRAEDTRKETHEQVEERLGAATVDTPLVALGLSARATNALERVGALNVGDLLTIRTIELNQLRGVGLKTRKELVAAQRALRPLLGMPEPADRARRPPTTIDEPDVQSLDELVEQLLPRQTARNVTEVSALRLLLGLDELEQRSGDWPSQTDVAGALDVTLPRVGQILAKAKDRWRRLPAVTRLRKEIAENVERIGGIAGTQEIARAIAAERGAAEPAIAVKLADAAARVAVEVELAGDQPRLLQRRTSGRVLIASAGASADERQRALEYAVRLGTCADELAAEDPLPGPADVAERLLAVAAPEWVVLGQERLVALAVAASQRAAVSARLELHPRGMAAARALTLSRGALLGSDEIHEAELRRRVAARFPDAEPLPKRPELDALIESAGLDLRYDERTNSYLAPERSHLLGFTSLSAPTSLDRHATTHTTRHVRREDPKVREADAFERRLLSALDDGGVLTLMAYPQQLEAAERELRRFDVTPIDVDALVLRRLGAAAEERNVRWDLVLRADGTDRASADWSRLTALVSHAMPAIEEEIATTPGTVLLEHPGLLARYGQIGIVDRLRTATMGSGAMMRGAWLLLPASDQEERPMLDGVAIPALTPNEWARIPKPWLENRHRSASPEAA